MNQKVNIFLILVVVTDNLANISIIQSFFIVFVRKLFRLYKEFNVFLRAYDVYSTVQI